MSTQERVDWNAVAGVRSSVYRRQVVGALQEGPKYATEIADDIGTSQAMVSSQFRWLERHNPPLVECLTPQRPHHLIYGLTEMGARVADQV